MLFRSRRHKRGTQTRISRSEPKATPSAMSQVAAQLKTQHPNVLEPAADFQRPSQDIPRFNKTAATDIPYRAPTRQEMPADIAQNVNAYSDAMRNKNMAQTLDQYHKDLEMAEDKKPSAQIRSVKRERPDGSIETTYEIINADGVTIKAGLSQETAKSLLKQYKQKYMAEQEPGNRAGFVEIKNVNDWAEKVRAIRELQKDIKLMSDQEAKAAVQQRAAELLKLGIERGYFK